MSGYVDFAAADGTIQVIPSATYRVVIQRWEKAAAKTGTPQIRVFAKVVGGEYDGCSLVDFIPATDKSGWRIANFLKDALGLSTDDLKALGKVSLTSEKLTRMFDLSKHRSMYWDVVKDNERGNNKVMSYINDPECGSVSIEDIDDLPDFISKE